MAITLLGGIGLFLLGMSLMTDGIRSFAGAALRDVLARFVRGPVTAMFSGAALTVAVQSSSATTLTTIGFVNAGLISFPQAIGVIFGANIGTTSIGWIVSIFGLKLSLSAIALPVIFGGAMLRLLGRGKLAPVGGALAGFGLLFFGIGLLQDGMAGLTEHFNPADLPGATFWGSLALVGIGFVMVVVMQASGAAVAVTLAALHAGAIDIHQGAALIIGQNIGTTLTAVIASIGASVAAKRTAAAHVVFNVLTGAIVFVLLPAFFWGVEHWEGWSGESAGAGALAAFHTGFSVLGVLIFLPLVRQFARFIEWMIPDHGSGFTRSLDPSVIQLGSVGLDAAIRSLAEILRVQVAYTLGLVRGARPTREGVARFEEARSALPTVAEFVARIGENGADEPDVRRRVDLMHAVDHLESLGETIDRLDDRPALLGKSEIDPVSTGLERLLLHAAEDRPLDAERSGEITALSEAIARSRRTLRASILEGTARGRVSATESGDLIEVIRGLDAVGYHTSRTILYLAGTPDQPPALDSSSVQRA